jgi:hypothetical protein
LRPCRLVERDVNVLFTLIILIRYTLIT